MDIRCQQFTSYEIANEMLDLLGYQHNLYGKTLLENSCGEGNILCLAVETVSYTHLTLPTILLV